MESLSEQAVYSRLESAKLCPSSMVSPIQTVYYDEQEESDLILLEVDKDILSEIERDDDTTLTIRGDIVDRMIICSDSKTYLVTEAGISNSLLVVPELNFADSHKEVDEKLQTRKVVKTCHVYWEPKQMGPSARKLYRLLEKNQYSGEESESESDQIEPTDLDYLLNSVQASRKELLEMLESLPVIFHKNQYRLLELQYQTHLSEYIFSALERTSFVVTSIDHEAIMQEVQQLDPPAVREHVLKWFFPDGVLSLAALCRIQGESILRYPNDYYPLEKFMGIWKISLPEGLEPDLKFLHGVAYVKDGNPKTIQFLSKWDLPEAESARFDALLNLKECWSLDEIQPYIEDLTVGGVSSLLLKYARAFQRNGETLYAKK